MSILKYFRKEEKPKSPETPPPPALRSGFFSTESIEVPGRSTAQRHEQALSMIFQRSHKDFKAITPAGKHDESFAMDSSIQESKYLNSLGGYLPIQQFEYFAGQSFIGWQTCALLSQNWLIDKACGMPGKDAVRHGYEITENSGQDVDPKVFDMMRHLDKKFKVKQNCIEFIKMGRVFGIRLALFLVDGIDYSLPFNPDGVRPGSYRGISQIDPYWSAPELDRSAAADPASKDFYDPTWWRIDGKRIHKSHFVIMRNGEDLPDILKPTYFYGGIPLPQKIYERVYAAERTANEAPLLAMTKRLTVLKMDLDKAMADMDKFTERMNYWVTLQNNFGIKVIGEGDEVDQFDTSLAALDETVMTQYQLVSSIAEVPATKLLGTSPKGFNATGEYEESSYHEFLESIQENELTPLIDRHHLLCMRSFIAPKLGIKPIHTEINWNPVDSPTAKELAEVNSIKAITDKTYSEIGALDSLDIRQKISNDKDSGYNGIPEIVPGGPGDREAEQEMKEALLNPSADNTAPKE